MSYVKDLDAPLLRLSPNDVFSVRELIDSCPRQRIRGSERSSRGSNHEQFLRHRRV